MPKSSMRRAMAVLAASMMVVLAGCGGGDSDSASVAWTSPCDLLTTAEVEQAIGAKVKSDVIEGSYGYECHWRQPQALSTWVVWLKVNKSRAQCGEPGTRIADELDVNAYKGTSDGVVRVGGPYKDHCLRLTSFVSTTPGETVTEDQAVDLMRTIRRRLE
ncbi:hypothetical protein ACQFX6_01160 [Streptomyces sp. DSM 41987]|uniref:hypothetical protein n=2 Tax=Streptomyces TaxID=1883 RepID=UPI0012767CB7|nr:hypothetical protein [Streptomyces fildesensis]MCZ4099391.1 hypothetical protein [Streptomyces sp. H39-C1]